MKSAFRRFRRCRRLSLVFMLLALGSFAGCMALVGGALGAAIGLTAFVLLGGVSAVLEWTAEDSAICPVCGQRVLKPVRNSFDRENETRYRAIRKGEPVVCVCCGARVETA